MKAHVGYRCCDLSTSANPDRNKMIRGYLPTTALAKSVDFDDALMHVTLMDGRVIGVPLAWFPLLRNVTSNQRKNYAISGGGLRLRWAENDEDISIAGLMAGADLNSL